MNVHGLEGTANTSDHQPMQNRVSLLFPGICDVSSLIIQDRFPLPPLLLSSRQRHPPDHHPILPQADCGEAPSLPEGSSGLGLLGPGSEHPGLLGVCCVVVCWPPSWAQAL